MCNRFVQQGREVRPQQNASVLMKGPGGYFEMEFEAVFGGPARNESRHYWIKRDGAEPVLVPDISRFGEKNQATQEQNWEDVPAGSAMEGLLLPRPSGKEYRLLKVVTQAATPEQAARLGNDRVPIFHLLSVPRDESIAEIEVQGKVARFDGLAWSSDDAELQRLCMSAADGLPMTTYRPSPLTDTLTEVAAALGGRVLKIPNEPDDAPDDDDVLF